MKANDLENFKSKIGQYIRFKREASNYSVRGFALLADVTHSQLINIEFGRLDIRFSTLDKIASAFKTDMPTFISEAMDFAPVDTDKS